jgi:hypothetical protein
MAKKKRLPDKLQAWVEARKKFHLSHAEVQMARELGMNPKKLGGMANQGQEPWKMPLSRFIEHLYHERFGRDRPDVVVPIEQVSRRQEQKKAARREAKKLRAAQDAGGRPSGTELERLLDRYVRLKRALVGYTQRNFRQAIVTEARRLSSDGVITDAEVMRATEKQLHRGPEAIDSFIAAHRGLSGADRVLVRSWKDGFDGIFRSESRDGRVLELHNLVDDLQYRTVLTSDDPEMWQKLGDAPCFISHIVPLGPLWTLSGSQRPMSLPDPRLYDGLAAAMAQDAPALLFRNPTHLAQGWEAVGKQHEAFLARFGKSWVAGSPKEIEELHREMLSGTLREPVARGAFESLAPELREAAKATHARLEHHELPAHLMEAETVGMLSHPREGLLFCAEFARFLAAFENPELGRDPAYRDEVLGYLESDTIPPAVFEMVAALDPGRASALLAIVLERPALDWVRDSNALLHRFKPGFFERPALPSILPLPHRMVEGLLALRRMAPSGHVAG